MNNQALIGLLRGAGYAALFAVLSFLGSHIGESGLLDTTTSGIVVAIVGALEHYLNAPSA